METFIANTIPSTPDSRDFAFSPIFEPGNRSTDLLHLIAEKEDQGEEPTCVAKSKNSLCESIVKQATGEIIDLSTTFVYQMGRKISQLPANIPGMVPRDALKAQARYGIPLQSEWEYTTDNLTATPPESVFASAATRKVSRYECVYSSSMFGGMERDQKVDRIKAALAEGLPVSFAMMVTNSLGKLTGPWKGHRYALCDGKNDIGGHNQDIYANDDAVNMFGVLNSWGADRGDNGIVGMPYSIVDEPFFEAWVIRGFNGMGIAEKPGLKVEVRSERTMVCRIVVPKEKLGTFVRVWMGIKFPDGRIFMKRNLHSNDWEPLVWPAFQHCAELTLDDDNPLTVISNMEFAQYAGGQVYVAYGTSPLDWELGLRCTV